jgi:hypothetical protein
MAWVGTALYAAMLSARLRGHTVCANGFTAIAIAVTITWLAGVRAALDY